jgi:hypothetical protein
MGTERVIKQLNAYLREVANVPFKWGEHDCFIFTNTAFHRMYGQGWADEWLDNYLGGDGYPLKKTKLQEKFGFNTFEEAADTRLIRHKGIPPRGALVTTTTDVSRKWYIGAAMGLSVGSSAAFLSTEGVVYLPIEIINNAWVIK